MLKPVVPIWGIALILGSALPSIPNLESLTAEPDVGPVVVGDYLVRSEARLTAEELRSRLQSIPEESPITWIGEMDSDGRGRHAIALFVPVQWSRSARLEAVRQVLGVEEVEVLAGRTSQ